MKAINTIFLVFLPIMASLAEHGKPPQGHGGDYGHEPHYSYRPAKYEYGYEVHDDYHGTNFGAKETRDGYATHGEYHVALPDGRIQTVTYHVADGYSGYVADVKYSGEPYYPPVAPKPYKPQAPAPVSKPVHKLPPPAPKPVYYSPKPHYS